ncbi:MAG: ABC transporter substrate-binding protein [Eubacteriales bacterium]|nr:ABC transporter substrate-binding protein [Eubacteriales bacterium]
MKKSLRILAAMGLSLLMSTTAMAAGKEDLKIAIDADVNTLHPSDWTTTSELNIENQIYDTLIFYARDGQSDPEPRLAESFEISEDGLTYTFHLRDGATFHDGSAITSEDAKFSIELYAQSEYQSSMAEIASVEAPDEKTVVITLANPYSPFLEDVSRQHIASKAYHDSVDEDTFANQPLGSGAYKFVSHAIGSSIELEAYEDYYRGAAPIKNVTFSVVPNTASIALMSGDIGFAQIQASDLAQLQAMPTITIEEVPTSGFSFLSMNTEKEPFNDVKVRQAINYAINRENIVSVVYDNEAEENSNICAKTRFGYSDEQPQYTYDPEKAKELLAEAGVEEGTNLGTILCADKYSNLATVLQADLAAVGLNCDISVEEFNAYIQDLTSGNYDLCALEMTLDGDTQMLEMAFTSDYIGTANNARYSDAEMDDLFAQARVENSDEKRLELYNQIFTKAQDEAVYAIIANPLELYAYDANLTVTDFVLEGDYYLHDFAWNE